MHQAATKPDCDLSGNSRAERWLMLCAGVLLVALGVALRPMLSVPARAEMVSQADHLVTMTAAGGTGDVLLVLDNRSEQLMVYKINAQNALELLENLQLPELFASARAKRKGK